VPATDRARGGRRGLRRSFGVTSIKSINQMERDSRRGTLPPLHSLVLSTTQYVESCTNLYVHTCRQSRSAGKYAWVGGTCDALIILLQYIPNKVVQFGSG
jgi:hypothetical protein